MIAALGLMVAFYGAYTVSLVVQDLSGFLAIAALAAGYILYFSFISRKPVHALYMFLLISLFFPKGGNNFVLFTINEGDGAGISLFYILQCVAAAAICLNILRFKAFRWGMPRVVKAFCLAVFLTVIASLIAALSRQLLAGSSVGIGAPPEELAWNAHMLIGFIFFCGCLSFVKGMNEIERMFKIVVLSAAAMIVESALYVYLALPLPLARYVIQGENRYNSIFFFDYCVLVLILLAATGFALHFALTRRGRSSLYWFAMVPLVFLPIVATLQRTPVLANIIILLTFLLLYRKISLRLSLGVMTLMIAGGLGFLAQADRIAERMQLVTTRRPEYFSSWKRSEDARLGSHLRGLEVILNSLPFGVGAARMPSVMGSAATPSYLRRFADSEGLSGSGETRDFYALIASGEHPTSSHNLYIDFVGEYGLLGLVSLMLFIAACAKHFRLAGGDRAMPIASTPALVAAQAASFSVLAGLAVTGMFMPYIFYWLVFFLLFVIVFTAQEFAKLQTGALTVARRQRDP